MAFLVTFHWGWLLASLLLGLAMGWIAVVHRAQAVSKLTSGWLAVLVAALVAAALAHVIPGRPGYWLDLGLIMFALYLAGCAVGAWLRTGDQVRDSRCPLSDVRPLQRVGQRPAVRCDGAAQPRAISRRSRRLFQIGPWHPQSSARDRPDLDASVYRRGRRAEPAGRDPVRKLRRSPRCARGGGPPDCRFCRRA